MIGVMEVRGVCLGGVGVVGWGEEGADYTPHSTSSLRALTPRAHSTDVPTHSTPRHAPHSRHARHSTARHSTARTDEKRFAYIIITMDETPYCLKIFDCQLDVNESAPM